MYRNVPLPDLEAHLAGDVFLLNELLASRSQPVHLRLQLRDPIVALLLEPSGFFKLLLVRFDRVLQHLGDRVRR